MITRTERGWAGHFCCADKCMFRRNTLIQKDNIFIVVSTVGNLIRDGISVTIGSSHYYETMIFYSLEKCLKYHDADVEKQIFIDTTKGRLDKLDDVLANDMHEENVEEVIRLLKANKL